MAESGGAARAKDRNLPPVTGDWGAPRPGGGLRTVAPRAAMGRLWRARGLLCLGKRRRPKDHGATAVGGTDPPTGEVERAATPAQRHSALEPGTRGCEPSAATSLPLQGGGGQTAREDGRNHGVRCPTPAEVARPPRPDAASCPSDREGGEGPGSYGQPPPRGGGVGQGFPLESHEDPEEYYDALSDASWFIEGEGCSIERDLQRGQPPRPRVLSPPSPPLPPVVSSRTSRFLQLLPSQLSLFPRPKLLSAAIAFPLIRHGSL